MPPMAEDLNIQRGGEKCDSLLYAFRRDGRSSRTPTVLYTRLVVLKLWLAEPYGPRVLPRRTPGIIFTSYYVLEGNSVNISEHRFI